MLGHEHGMTAHGGLVSVPMRRRWSETLVNETRGMLADRRKAARLQVVQIALAQFKTAAETGTDQPCLQFLPTVLIAADITHVAAGEGASVGCGGYRSSRVSLSENLTDTILDTPCCSMVTP